MLGDRKKEAYFANPCTFRESIIATYLHFHEDNRSALFNVCTRARDVYIHLVTRILGYREILMNFWIRIIIILYLLASSV